MHVKRRTVRLGDKSQEDCTNQRGKFLQTKRGIMAHSKKTRAGLRARGTQMDQKVVDELLRVFGLNPERREKKARSGEKERR